MNGEAWIKALPTGLHQYWPHTPADSHLYFILLLRQQACQKHLKNSSVNRTAQPAFVNNILHLHIYYVQYKTTTLSTKFVQVEKN